MSGMEQRQHSHTVPVLSAVLLTLAIASGAFIYLYLEHTRAVAELSDERDQLAAAHASTTATLTDAQAVLSDRESTITRLEERVDELQDELEDERDQNDVFREQIVELTGTVSTLDQLAKLDRELLLKYSRTFFLNENYRPRELTEVPKEWILESRNDQYFLPEAWPFLEDMLEDAEDDGIDLRVLSGFRSFDEQRDVNQQFQRQFGSGANQFSADQGFSEHQIGTAVDIVDPETAAATQAFAQTEAYEWLQDNAHRYGFILSYPEGNEYYIFEPWHWRFVGEELADDLHDAGEHFYDWDQRRINEYLITIFE